MPLIKRLVKGKQNLVRVHFLDHPSLNLRTDDVLKFGLIVGKDLPLSLISKLKKNTLVHNYFEKALNFISYRPRSVHETRLRLKRLGATSLQIKQTITKLLHYDYLNEQNFASWLANSRLKNFRSPSLIRAELSSHHIDDSLITSILSPHTSTKNQLELAKDALLKKFKSLPQVIDNRLRQKLYSYLIRRGFSFQTVSSVIDEITKNE